MRSRRKRAVRESQERLELRLDAIAAGAGFRVLRELGEGGTAVVGLVVPLDADPFGPLDPSRSVVKVPRFDGRGAGGVREDRILASVRSPHVVALLGTPGTDATGLRLEYLPGGTLADLLARREFLRVGEAVTILVSMVRALAAIHAAGHWHGSLSASKVLFAADGRPVVVGLSHAVPVAAEPVSGPGESAAAPDDDGFREVVALLAQAVGDEKIIPGAGELMALSHSGLSRSIDAFGWQQLEERAFGIARPEPVLLDAAFGRTGPGCGTIARRHTPRDAERLRSASRNQLVDCWREFAPSASCGAPRRSESLSSTRLDPSWSPARWRLLWPPGRPSSTIPLRPQRPSGERAQRRGNSRILNCTFQARRVPRRHRLTTQRQRRRVQRNKTTRSTQLSGCSRHAFTASPLSVMRGASSRCSNPARRSTPVTGRPCAQVGRTLR